MTSAPGTDVPYTTNLPLARATEDDVLLVHTWEGQPLPREHGGPVRVITPKLYAWKGTKWVRRIEFLSRDHPGFWEVRGYSNTAEPWLNDRYSRLTSTRAGLRTLCLTAARPARAALSLGSIVIARAAGEWDVLGVIQDRLRMKRRYLSLVGCLTFTLILFGWELTATRTLAQTRLRVPAVQVPTLQRTSGLVNGTDLREHFFGLKAARVGTKSLFRILTAREFSKEVVSALRSSSSAMARKKLFARQVARKLR